MYLHYLGIFFHMLKGDFPKPIKMFPPKQAQYEQVQSFNHRTFFNVSSII